MNTSINRRIGIMLGLARRKNKLTQTEVAEHIGKTAAWLSHIERGRRCQNLDIGAIRQVALKVGYKSLWKLIKDCEENIDVLLNLGN